jgi:ELWxxDGT repeat protein
VKDINAFPLNLLAYDFVSNGTLTLFAAATDATGPELWRSDGTTAGTFLVKDIRPGPVGSLPGALTAFGSSVVFVADDGTHGRELWISDGTEAGTRMVLDIEPGEASSDPAEFLAIDDVLLFAATTSGEGREVWLSDGTEGGTFLLASIQTGPGGSNPHGFVAGDNIAYCIADDGLLGYELWGVTGFGAFLVKDINVGGAANLAELHRAPWGGLVFQANDGISGDEPWTSTGDVGNATRLADIVPGAGGPILIRGFTDLGTKVVFAALLPDQSSELWITDGTPGGTSRLKGSFPFPGVSTGGLLSLTQLGGAVLFSADDGITGRELWRTDGTPVGTQLLKDIRSGDASSSPSEFAVVGGTLFFQANDGASGRELWRSDGTAAGTTLVADLNPGPFSSDPRGATVLGSTLLFLARSDRIALWRTDGSAAGTTLAFDFSAGTGTLDSNLHTLTPLGNGVVFWADDAVHGTELWGSDGTSAGTRLLHDVDPFEEGQEPMSGITAFDGAAYFPAEDPVHGLEPWRTDGTPAGTALLADLLPGRLSSDPGEGVVLGGALFFGVGNAGPSLEGQLFKTDGTAAGTLPVKDVRAVFLGVVGDRLLFEGRIGKSGQLWTSDGTADGTVLVKDLRLWSDPFDFNGTALFGAAGLGEETELWRSDGTAPGTLLIRDIDPSGGSFPSGFQQTAGFVYFMAYDEGGRELWKTDGTPSGTTRLKDIRPGMLGGLENTPVLAAANNRIVFPADDGTFGREPWVSDGTPDGTTLLADICSGECTSSADAFISYKGLVYFLANAPSGMVSLWRTDGTPAGTQVFADLFPSRPEKFTPFSGSMVEVNGRFFFRGHTDATGTELWALLVDGAEQLAYLIREARAILTDLRGGKTQPEKDAARALGARLAALRSQIEVLLATSSADIAVQPKAKLDKRGKRTNKALRKAAQVKFARLKKDRRRALKSLDKLEAILVL